jgi:hypothetical protein
MEHQNMLYSTRIVATFTESINAANDTKLWSYHNKGGF